MLMAKERRPAIRTLRGWAISVLQEAGAIRECETHGWMQDRADPHARERAFDIARQESAGGALLDHGDRGDRGRIKLSWRHLPRMSAGLLKGHRRYAGAGQGGWPSVRAAFSTRFRLLPTFLTAFLTADLTVPSSWTRPPPRSSAGLPKQRTRSII